MTLRMGAWWTAGTGGRIALGAAALGGIVLLGGCGLRIGPGESFTDDDTISQRVSAVLLNTGSGELHIRTGSGQETTVHRKVTFHGDRPGRTHRIDGATLVLDSCGRDFCDVDYEVVVPAGTKVTGEVGSGGSEFTGVAELNLHVGSGDVTARGIAGAVAVRAGSGQVVLGDIGGPVAVEDDSGQVTAGDVRGDLNVRFGSGDVKATGVGGKADLEGGSGAVDLDMAAARDVRVYTGSGAITVRVPPEPYQVTAHSGSGEENVSIATDPNAPRHMNLKAGSGDVTVLTR